MKILFDQGTPRPLRNFLTGHEVITSRQQGWATLENGDLLTQAENLFDLLITTDKNLVHQQNLTGLRLAILVLPTTNWNEVKLHTREVLDAVNSVRPGEYRELHW